MKIDVDHISGLDKVTNELVSLMKEYRIFLLTGGLGAGKTTLVKSWMQLIGVTDRVTSPTFSLINHYKARETNIYHIDLYRLKSLEEAYNIGIEEYLEEAGSVIIIEWPDLILPLIDESYISISIVQENDLRTFNIEPHRVV